ncbi:hypothetical protein CH330_06985 [candidate division WOR-3 bacterium JGI_Cruoil_03_51_56]|uniref:Glutaredoxin domain-containing protein n=1 Tax=candidate division WOR-3 bacterium JGI_Cruoil_03_51_56 TaxID=1973747 RepID=A0A235BTT5_UNCW3|nr:MAG: hypothetical protein CH330_06985 [candidate division WOR-3 bacterium JGI_Cruoil_03_51_56]
MKPALTFRVFAKENCPVCRKAQGVLARLGVNMVVRYVEGSKATSDNIADFAWFDWTDKAPLIVVTEGDRVLKRWDGTNVAGRWMPEVKEWLAKISADSVLL